MVDASDHSLLEMALIGYEAAKETIDSKISDIKKIIGSGRKVLSAAVESVAAAPARKRRTMSAAGRKRVAAAQRKRWAALRAAKAAPTTKAKRKGPKVSPAKMPAGQAKAKAAGGGT